MADKSRAELVLEIIKIFIWPVLIVFAVMWLGPDLKEMLKNRTWKIGVLEMGDRISTLKDTMQDSLLAQQDYLSKIKENAANPQKVKELSDAAVQDIENTQKGVKNDIRNIQEVIPQKPLTSTEESSGNSKQKYGKTSPASAREWELAGFRQILERDVSAAINSFSEAEKNWPDYHNVAEIRRKLVSDRQSLASKDSPGWKVLYQHLLNELSWGMPADVRQKMQMYTGQP
ncbi:hypothetical protein [Desulfobacterium sp. N47]|uniref:Uncharacterized protein n=1 Tax=uncultured Desulfobacterium sp. TaxID=201089 RepID=E1YJW8_9BACT|nr:hypothetical protein N47_E50840 [uncultured Desulfobacterium sp.]